MKGCDWIPVGGIRHLRLPNGRVACGINASNASPSHAGGGLRCVVCRGADELLSTAQGKLLYAALGTPIASGDALSVAKHVVEFHSLLATQLREISARVDALYKPPQAE